MPTLYIYSLADVGETTLSGLKNGSHTVVGAPSTVTISDNDSLFQDGPGEQFADPEDDQILTSNLVIDGEIVGVPGDHLYNAGEGTLINQSVFEVGNYLLVTLNGVGDGSFIGFATTIPLALGQTFMTFAPGTSNGSQPYDTIVYCFTGGTRIRCGAGEVPVEEIGVSDLVHTVDNGLQPVRWIGKRHLSASELRANPELVPVTFARDCFGPGTPGRELSLSPEHRILWRDTRAELMFGQNELIVSSRSVVGTPGCYQKDWPKGVDYFHILFDRHEIVQSEGLYSESFHPEVLCRESGQEDVADELHKLFPELGERFENYGQTARTVLKRCEMQLLCDLSCRAQAPHKLPILK